MPDVTAGTGDSRTRNASTTSWSDAQGSATTTGNAFTGAASTDDFAIYNIFTAGRTGAATHTITRSYFPFDLSSLSLGAGEGIVSANLVLTAKIITGTGGHTTGTAAHDKIYIRGASALAGDASDFGNVYSSGTTKFASFGSGTASTTEGSVDITFNSDGISFLTSFMGSGTATIAALGFMDDQDTAPGLLGGGSDSSVKIKLTYADNGSSLPTLELGIGSVSSPDPIVVNRFNVSGGCIIKGGTLKILG